MNTSPVTFYRVNEPYGEFSNFSHHSVKLHTIGGKRIPYAEGNDSFTFQTSEHAFQAAKFLDIPDMFMHVAAASSPNEAMRRGRTPMSPEALAKWERIKDRIMYEIVYAKFCQHGNLRKLLLSTGDKTIIEASPYDTYWGWGSNKNGKNKLGKLLVEIRQKIRDEQDCAVLTAM